MKNYECKRLEDRIPITCVMCEQYLELDIKNVKKFDKGTPGEIAGFKYNYTCPCCKRIIPLMEKEIPTNILKIL